MHLEWRYLIGGAAAVEVVVEVEEVHEHVRGLGGFVRAPFLRIREQKLSADQLVGRPAGLVMTWSDPCQCHPCLLKVDDAGREFHGGLLWALGVVRDPDPDPDLDPDPDPDP